MALNKGKVQIGARLFALLAGLLVLFLNTSFAPGVIESLDPTPPEIGVWYGPRQVFGQPGLAQRWVNVLGKVSSPEIHKTRVVYSLNGGPYLPVRLGPDHRRLAHLGDFNIELDPARLKIGENTLLIRAVNAVGAAAVTQVTLVYQPRELSLPYELHWADVNDPQQALQIVDGLWQWDARGIHTVETGYDRMLVIGDADWTNYQLTAAVTFYGEDPAGFRARHGGAHAGVSFDLRWLGHSDDPEQCPPPRCGWNPVGDFAKYFARKDGQTYLGLKVKEKEQGFRTLPYRFEAGHTYLFKASVQTTPQGNLYRMSVWEPVAEPEPADWMFESLAPPGSGNPDHGAFAFVAHFADVSLGDLQVIPLP